MNFNELTNWHQETLKLLINFLPQYQNELSYQINNAIFSVLSDGISLEINTRKNSNVLDKLSIPVELEAIDVDSMTIHGLLQCNNGLIGFLEFYREDGEKIIKLPSASEFMLNSYGL
jgi:hypothetical protein